MTVVITIYKADGTLQCCPDGPPPRPIAEDAAYLAAKGLVVVAARNEPGPDKVIQVCCGPTGRVNAFDIDVTSIKKEAFREIAADGWRVWSTSEDGPHLLGGSDVRFPMEFHPFPMPHEHPVLIADMVGRRVRVYREGDPITRDYQRDRTNFVLSPKTGLVLRYWFG
jgi:hypothetical protein